MFVVLFIVFTPLVYSKTTVDITLLPQFLFFSCSLLLFVVLLFLFGIHKKFFLPINRITITLIGYFLFSVTSLIGALSISEGLFEVTQIGIWIVFIIITLNLLRTYPEIKYLIFKAFVLSSLLVSLIGLAQILGIGFTKLPGQLVPYGTFGNRNIYTPALLLTLPFVILEIIWAESDKWKWFAIISGLLNVLVVLLSCMRTAWLALALAILITMIILLVKNKRNSLEYTSALIRKIKIVVISLVFLGIAGAFVFVIKSDEKKANVGKLWSFSSTNERTTLWKKSIEMFFDHPVNGVGEGNWRIMLPNYTLTGLPREAVVGEMHYQRPENDFIWILSETGLVGFISYLLLFVFAFDILFKRLVHSLSPREKNSVFILIGSLILYIVIAMFGFPKERTFLTLEFGFLISLILAEQKSSSVPSKSVNITPILFILILLVGMYLGYNKYAGEVQTQKIIQARSENQNEQVIKYSELALKKGYVIDPTSTPINFYKGVAYYSLNNIDSALYDFELAKKVHPYHLHVLNNLGTCYEAKGNHAKAIECLSEATRISPDFQDALINLSAAYFNSGNLIMARKVITKCRINKSNKELETLHKVIDKKWNDSIISTSINYFNTGNITQANQSIQTLKIKDPKIKEIKAAIINYRKDSVIKLAERYFKNDSLKAAKLELLKCRGCNTNPRFAILKTELDKKMGIHEKSR